MKRFVAALMCMAFFAAPALAQNAASVTIDLQFGSQMYKDTVEVRWDGGASAYGRITRDKVYLRHEPNTSSGPIVEMPEGTVCRINGQVTTDDEVWLYVTVTVGKYTYKGYVRSDMLEIISTPGEGGEFFSGAPFEGPFRQGDTHWQIRLVQQALRDLDYYPASYKISGSLGSATLGAINDFRKEHSLPQNQTLDQQTYRAIIDEYIREGGGSASTPVTGTVYNVDWFTYRPVLNEIGLEAGQGKSANILLTDLMTGKSLHIYVQSTGNHVDVEPLTASDTNTLCDIFGVSSPSQISYRRRPMMLTLTHDGETYSFVCSMYGEPHGTQEITDNGYNGQFCLHFKNSKMNVSDSVDDAPDGHQEMIQRAIGMLTYQGVTVQEFTGL